MNHNFYVIIINYQDLDIYNFNNQQKKYSILLPFLKNLIANILFIPENNNLKFEVSNVNNQYNSINKKLIF